MAEEQEPQKVVMEQDDSANARMSVALILIIAFVGLLYGGVVQLNATSAIMFLALLYGVATLNWEEKDKIGFFGLFWGLFLIAFVALPEDYKFSATLLLLSGVLTFAASWEVRILVVGFTALNIFFFGATVLSFIEFMVIVLFVYSALKGVGFGAMMLIPLLAVGWFIGSGWGDIIEQKVGSIGTQVSVDTGISTEDIGSGLASALNNTLLLLTDPNAWYENQFASKGTRDVGETASALEITSIEALPNTVQPEDTFDIMFELENKGKRSAENVNINALGGSLAEACGKVDGKLCDPGCLDSPTEQQLESLSLCGVTRTLGKLAPLEKVRDSFTFQAPNCPGTYSVAASVTYKYNAEATLNLQMIARDYYDDLLQNNRMKWIDELSVASAGPFKVTLRTDRQQPIPVLEAGDAKTAEPQKFKIFFGLILEHDGDALVDSAVIRIPADFELIDVRDGSAPGSEEIDESCGITYDFKDKSGKYLSDYRKTAKDVADYKKNTAAFRELALDKEGADGYISYRPIDIGADKSVEMHSQDTRYFSCRFRVEPERANSVQQVSTFMVRSEIGYTFEYSKPTTITVRQVGGLPPQCRKDTQSVSAISTAQTEPQTKDAIVAALVKQIYTCFNKYAGPILLIGEDKPCGEFKVDIKDCEDKITASDIADAMAGSKAYSKVDIDVYHILNTARAKLHRKPIDKPATEIFTPDKVYNIEMEYHVPNVFTGNDEIWIKPVTSSADTACKTPLP